jgi:hypothetical protein
VAHEYQLELTNDRAIDPAADTVQARLDEVERQFGQQFRR